MQKKCCGFLVKIVFWRVQRGRVVRARRYVPFAVMFSSRMLDLLH